MKSVLCVIHCTSAFLAGGRFSICGCGGGRGIRGSRGDDYEAFLAALTSVQQDRPA